MKILERSKRLCNRRSGKLPVAGIVFLATLILGSTVLGLGAPLKFSPTHWLKNIPAPPADVSVAEAACPDIRALPERITAARSEAEKLAGDGMAMEQLVPELMMRGNITLLQEMARMEQERHLSGSGPQPLQRHQAMTKLDDLRKELRSALSRVSEGLPTCHVDEKRGIADTACIEKNNQTINERTRKAYNNYLHAVQGPLLTLRKEVERLIATEESINRVESGTDSPGVHKYMLQQRIGLLDVVRDYARERGNTCVYPNWQSKEAQR